MCLYCDFVTYLVGNYWKPEKIKRKLSLWPALCWWPGTVSFAGTVASLALTLNARVPSYLGWTRSISWLLMPWLLTSPGHRQPWYWLCRVGRFLWYLRKDFNYLRRINVENDTKCKYMFIFSLTNLARKGLSHQNALWLGKNSAISHLLMGGGGGILLSRVTLIGTLRYIYLKILKIHHSSCPVMHR